MEEGFGTPAYPFHSPQCTFIPRLKNHRTTVPAATSADKAFRNQVMQPSILVLRPVYYSPHVLFTDINSTEKLATVCATPTSESVLPPFGMKVARGASSECGNIDQLSISESDGRVGWLDNSTHKPPSQDRYVCCRRNTRATVITIPASLYWL